MPTPFETLNLPETASPSEIRLAYWTLAKTAHPDAGGTPETFNALKVAQHAALALAIATPCPTCKGRGVIHTQAGFNVLVTPCLSCGGTGKKY